MSPNPNKRFRNFASTAFILVLLAAVLGFYFFKYVPERRTEFNRNAFLELGQIQNALQAKSQGYFNAFSTIIPSGAIDTNMLSAFNYKHEPGDSLDADDVIQPSHFERDTITRRWNMVYDVLDEHKKDKENKPKKVCTLSKDVDSLISGLVSTYKDIFDGYLLIGKVRSMRTVVVSGHKHIKRIDTPEKEIAKIIFHSDDLSLDYQVNPDSLLLKNEAVSTMNILDVTIAGNPYKLFLYPFEMGRQKLTLTGVISDSNYREATQKIPFTIFTVFSVLLLLLIIHLPILRIFVLGPDERIRASDIRLIIGSYFIAAFFGFFVFSKIFLDKEQSIQNRNHLDLLANKIISNFQEELDSINQQLFSSDTALKNISKEKDRFSHPMDKNKLKPAAIAYLDKRFKPTIYPYSTGVFWLNSSGRWVARWSFRYSQTKTKMISVNDRTYFSDFKIGKVFPIPGKRDSFTIQPTLSKLEGEYIINVAKKSIVPPYAGRTNAKKDSVKPFLIGLSSRMHSVSGVILPPGYGFSIIDKEGKIQFDSREGRPLLSNILTEVENPGAIQQTAIYRNRRYFEHLQVRSKNMALLSTPLDGTPYQLLVYYNHIRSDAFEEHLVALSAGLIGTVVFMLLLSSLVNQWSKAKNRMLESRSQHFEWLYPCSDRLKRKYYRHLINWMLLLLAIYLLAWLVMDKRMPGSEFSMLFISLLFPFYITLHYYELRERFYDVSEHRTSIEWYFARPSLALRGLLWFFIIIINCFVPFYIFSGSMALPVLITQLIWALIILISAVWFRKNLKESDVGNSTCEGFAARKEDQATKKKIPISYILAILTGVSLISVIPASGIFWLFFREETGLYQKADQLIVANRIDERRQLINQYLKDYKFIDTNVTDQRNIRDLKFSRGIYTLSGWTAADTAGISYSPNHYPSADYIHMHERLIPDDSISWIEPADSARDGSWFFGQDKTKPNAGPALAFLNSKDEINPITFHLTADSTASWNVLGLLVHSFCGDGPTFPIFFIVGLVVSLAIAYFLTRSLSRRIFLLELQLVARHIDTKDNPADNTYEGSKLKLPTRLIILETLQQLKNLSSEKDDKNKSYDFPEVHNFKDIYCFEKNLPMRLLEARMPLMIETLEPVYSSLWDSLSTREKFILFDFAQDGFANYKAGKDLQALTKKGLLFFDDLRIRVMTLSFQEYVLQQKDDKELMVFLADTGKRDTWKKIRTPLFIILTAFGIFIFVTQDAIYQKITGLLTSLTSLLPLLSNLFNKPVPGKQSDT